jgi:hypothetical protein
MLSCKGGAVVEFRAEKAETLDAERCRTALHILQQDLDSRSLSAVMPGDCNRGREEQTAVLSNNGLVTFQ